MNLHTTFKNDPVDYDSSPYFLVKPIYISVNTPWQYNPLPIDPDNDSLSWYIGTPNESLGSPIGGYSNPPSDPSNPFSIDLFQVPFRGLLVLLETGYILLFVRSLETESRLVRFVEICS